MVVHEERGLQADEAGGRGVEVVEAEDGPGVAGHGEGVAGHQGPGEGVVVQIVSLERGESGDQQEHGEAREDDQKYPPKGTNH